MRALSRTALAVAALVIGAPGAAQTAARTFEFTLPESAPACAPQPGGATSAIALDELERETASGQRGVALVFANGLTLLLAADGKLLDPAVDHRGETVGSLVVDASGRAALTLVAPTNACPALRASGRASVGAIDIERGRRLAAASQGLVAADAEGDRARFDTALERVDDALRTRTELLGADDALVANVLMRRAGLLVAAGRPREAVSLLEGLPASVRRPVAVRASIGLEQTWINALKWAGRPGVALPLAQQEVVRAVELLGADDAYAIRAQRELGGIYRDVRRFDEAITLFQQMRPVLVARYGEEGRRTLDNDLMVAGSLNEAGRYEEALRRIDPLLATLRRLFGDDDPLTQLALSNRFSCLFELREHDKAAIAVQELLEIRRRVYGPHHPRTLFALRGLAVTQWARGAKDAAIELDRQVIEGYDAVYGPDHPDTLRAIANATVTLQESGQHAQALALAGRVVDSVESQQDWASLAPETRQSYFSRWANTYKIKGQLHAQLGDDESAFRMIELTKARTLLDATTTRLARNAAIDDPAERAAVAQLEQRMEALNAEHARAIGDPERRTRIDLERNRVAAELRTLNDRLAARYPRFAALRDLRAVSAQQLQSVLPPRTLFLDYSLEGERVTVAAISRERGLSMHLLGDIPRLIVNLEALATAMSTPDADSRILWKDEAGRFSLMRPESDVAVRPARVAELAEQLAKSLIEPLAELIESHNRVIVSPDSELALVPLEALPFRGAPLVRRIEVAYAPSAAVFWLSQAQARELDRRSGRVGLLALGGVDYAGTGAGAAEITGPLDLATLARRADAAHRSFGPLPASRREVEQAAGHLRGAGVRTLLGRDANKSALSAMSRSGELQKYRTILISAHGVLDAERPALSAIVLAPDADGERFVTAAEWMTYRLASDLIVASGCETARGAAVNGEGVTGLPFAFHAAGSARSLLTLWKVDDAATARFIEAYFARLAKGEPPSRALRAVKLEFLGDRRVAQPFYWAPFVLFGAADSVRQDRP